MKKELMSIKKWNKNKLLLRILTFPIKLIFQLFWGFVYSFLITFKWLKNGSQELIYSDDTSDSLVKIIDQNKKIIEYHENNMEQYGKGYKDGILSKPS